MPSLHIGWASWCAFGMWPLVRRRWTRAAVLLYPALTLFCIVVTGNHFWIDGVGGIIVFALGYAIGTRMHRWNHERLDRRMASHPSV
jgi:membrane-associated phospholipid phosphatase